MQTFTYQISNGSGDDRGKPVHSEAILADSLGEAVDKARAITRSRPLHESETVVCLIRGDDTAPAWMQSVAQIRAGDRLASEGGGGTA